jgi:DNA-binding response OmpR family regulator
MAGPEHEESASSTDGTIRVLFIEDDKRLARLTASYLDIRGLAVTVVHDGASGLEEVFRNQYDVVLLDLVLPRKDGMEVCRAIRARSDVPIIMVTALGDEGDRITGLGMGADDYLPKPFSAPELLARIRALVRRYRGKAGPWSRPVEVGGLSIDPGARVAKLDGQKLDLTTTEFNILFALAERAGRVLNRDQLLDLAKGSAEEAFDRSIDGHISRLRKKLGDDPRKPKLLKTVRGAGYMLATGDEH